MMYYRSFFTLLLFLGLTAQIYPCTRIFNNKEKDALVGRTLDWSKPLGEELWLCPSSEKSKYGSLILVCNKYDNAVIEGLNEKGLAIHLLERDETIYEPKDARKSISYASLIPYLLDRFASVNEVLDEMKTLRIEGADIQGVVYKVHFAIEDETGDSAIIEMNLGKMEFFHHRAFSVLANNPSYTDHLKNLKDYTGFGGNKPIPGGTASLDRFVRGEYYLQYSPMPKGQDERVHHLFNVLSLVSIPYGINTNKGEKMTPTSWVCVSDLKNKTFHFKDARNGKITKWNLVSLLYKKDVKKKCLFTF